MEFSTNNLIYSKFFSKSKIEAKVEKTKWRGKPSDNSFCFINPDVKYKQREDEVLNKLKEVFGIQNDSFDEKYRLAISGDGQEVKRISTLHSSSLAALLLLYSVSNKKVLKCSLDGKDYIFNDCYFEVKTNVKDGHFSNMDVVLVGMNSEGKDVIFFLESKFSEYLNTGMCNNISIDAYWDKYDELGLFDPKAIPELLFGKGQGTGGVDCLHIKSSNPKMPQYCDGIKQMISHYMGVTNFIEFGAKALDSTQNFGKLVELLDKGAEIILGEVLFAFDGTIDKKGKLLNYSSIYKKLAKILNNKSPKLHVLNNVLTYQKLLGNFALNDKVKAFYQL